MILFRVEPYVARDYGRVEDMSNSLGVFIGRNKLEQGMGKNGKYMRWKDCQINTKNTLATGDFFW